MARPPPGPGRAVIVALARYQESQSGYAIITEAARHAVLDIGDRMQGLRDAHGPAEPGWAGDPGTGGTPVSLVCAALRDAVDPSLDVLSREIGFAAPATWRAASRYFH